MPVKYVFIVQHLHRLPQGEEDVKIIGIYKSREAAHAAVVRVCEQPGFRDFPKLVNHETDDDDQGFHIDKYRLDMDHWKEGFVTV